MLKVLKKWKDSCRDGVGGSPVDLQVWSPGGMRPVIWVRGKGVDHNFFRELKKGEIPSNAEVDNFLREKGWYLL